MRRFVENIVSVSEHTKDIFRTVGRTFARSGSLVCDFSCTGIRFDAVCEGDVFVEFKTSAKSYFTVYVDGVRESRRIAVTSKKPTWVKIADDLERGNHEIMLVKQSQFTMASTELARVKLTGSYCALPAEREMFIEFYGDSILNGSNIFLGGPRSKPRMLRRRLVGLSRQISMPTVT